MEVTVVFPKEKFYFISNTCTHIHTLVHVGQLPSLKHPMQRLAFGTLIQWVVYQIRTVCSYFPSAFPHLTAWNNQQPHDYPLFPVKKSHALFPLVPFPAMSSSLVWQVVHWSWTKCVKFLKPPNFETFKKNIFLNISESISYT